MDHQYSDSYDKGCDESSSKETRYERRKTTICRIENSIYFSDRITYDTAHELIRLLRLIEIDHLNDVKAADLEMRKSKFKYADIRVEPIPILLHLTTHGGIVHAAFSIVDCIRSLKVPVHTIITGYVASAGTLISLAGTKRIITPNSFMMIHEIRSGFWGRYSDARVEHENLTKLMEHVTRYYLERTKLTREKLTEMLRVDTDLTATESLELGLVDSIGLLRQV